MAFPNGIAFDGVNDFLTRGGGLTDAVDSKLVTGSVWINTAVAATQHIIDNAGIRFEIIILNNGVIQIVGRNSAGSNVLVVQSSAGYADGTWYNIAFSFDMAATENRHLYIADILDLNVFTYDDDTLDFTVGDWFFGANSTVQTQKMDGALAQLALWPGVYFDLSVEANRRELVGAGGRAVEFNADGSTASLPQPIIFLEGAAVDWHTNLGTGGGFTENGELTDAATDPPTGAASGVGSTLQSRIFGGIING